MTISIYFRLTASQSLIAGMSAMAWSASGIAQSNVVMYGLIDNGLLNISIKNNGQTVTTKGLVSGGLTASRWGLRGAEVLSSGLKAKFEFESGININNGTYLNQERAFGRASWVGLAGDWGEVRVGRQYSATTDYFVFEISPFGNSFNQAGIGRSGFRASDVIYQDRLVKYLSPQIEGFEFSTSYSFNSRGDEQASRSDNTRSHSVGGRYQNERLKLIATYDRVLPSREDPNANGRKPSAIQVGAVAHFQPVRLYAAWTTQRDGWIKLSEGAADGDNSLGSAGYFDGKVDAWLLGLQYTQDKHKVFGTFQYVNPSQQAFANANAVNVFNLGYTYELSKRTLLYTMASYFDGDLYTFRPDSHTRRYGGGLMHRF